MKKDYKVLSNKRCVKCSERLKQNLVDRHPDAELCFKHWVLEKMPHLKYKRLHIKWSEGGAV